MNTNDEKSPNDRRAPSTPAQNPASQPHGTTQDQVNEMESEGQATKQGQSPEPPPPGAPVTRSSGGSGRGRPFPASDGPGDQRRYVMTRVRLAAIIVLLLALLAPQVARAQAADASQKFVQVANGYQVTPNITYLTANNWDSKLDVYQPRGLTAPNPTLVYFHGGGWTAGSKEGSSLTFLPYLEMGWTVVNVGYRLASVSLAPAAVEDARCALRWMYRNAKQYNFDLTRIVTTGNSAGAHLALTTGMLPASAGMERLCPGDRGAGPVSTEEMKVAAIVNWYGITDVAEMLDGPNRRSYAVAWLGSMTNREEIATRVSPLTYVRQGLPPVLTIHGDADPTVPYTQAVRLGQALEKAGVPSELVTVPGGRHGGFTLEENVKIYGAIRSFLTRHGLLKRSPSN
jgi:acetyl esterase/lipase